MLFGFFNSINKKEKQITKVNNGGLLLISCFQSIKIKNEKSKAALLKVQNPLFTLVAAENEGIDFLVIGRPHQRGKQNGSPNSCFYSFPEIGIQIPKKLPK